MNRKYKVIIANLLTYSGGGVYVTISIAQILAEAGHEVYLFSLNGLDAKNLDTMYGTSLSKFIDKNLHINYLGIPAWIKPSAFLSRLFINGLKGIIERIKPDIIFVFDDIPSFFAEEYYKDIKVILYSHFPIHGHKILLQYNSLKWRIIDRAGIILASGNYYLGRPLDNWYIIANSRITALFLDKMFGKVDLILYPPVNNISINGKTIAENKNRVITSIGVMEPGKRFEVVIKAMRNIRNGKLIIIGTLANKRYAKYLMNLIKMNNLNDHIKILFNVQNDIKWYVLQKSMIITHQKIFEPFGIAVVEGMSMNNVPIVYRGPSSGPWIDIIDNGRYGFGFKDEFELENIIYELFNNKSLWKDYSNKALSRSKVFSYDVFKERIIMFLDKNVL